MPKRQRKKEPNHKKIINKQKNIIKDLKKKAGRGDKLKQRFEDLELELMSQIERESTHRELQSECPKCKKGTLEFIDLNVRKMSICNYCDYREVSK